MAKVRPRTLPSGKKVWQVNYRDGGGKRRAKQFEKKGDADAYLIKAGHEVAQGTHTADSMSITVAAAAELWLRRCEAESLEESTVRSYRQHVNLGIIPRLGATKISKLTTPTVEAFKDHLLATRSRALAAKILTSLKAVIGEACRRGHAAHNPAADVKVSKKNRERKPIEIPTKAELRLLLERVEQACGANWRPFVITAMFTGMRLSELRAVRWSDVDLKAGVISVRQRADFRKRLGPPKSEAGYRDIPMVPMVQNTLKEWKLACPKGDADLVFPTRGGRVYGMSKVWNLCWSPLLASCGLLDAQKVPRYRFHALRHAAASLFIEQGWSPKKVMAVMGHSTIAMTFDTYGKLFDAAEKDREDVAQIENRLFA